MYKTLPTTQASPKVNTTSLMSKSGVNLRDLPQLMTPENALIIRNYLITAEGGLEKRKGIDELFDASSANSITMLEKWTADIYIYSYANTVAAYRISTGVSTNIKTNFVNTDFTGTRYGDYFFVASSGDKIGRLSQILAYDTQTANYATGLVLTGGTSGATAVILEDADGGATGTLTLGNISGVFVTGETITDSATGSAKANGALGFAFTSIGAAPKARIVKAIDTRLFAGDLEDNRASVKYCDVDTGANPPFTTWTVGTAATQSGLVSYRNAGTVKVIENLGNVIIAGCADGKWAFTIDTIDSSGTLSKVDNTVMYRIDSGMDAAIHTDEGVYYINNEGLWQLVSLGQSNIAFSDQEFLISNQLGNDYFDDITLTNAAMMKDDKTNTLFIAVSQDSSTNNLIITYNTSLKAFGTFTGIQANRFLNDNGTLYTGIVGTAKVFKYLFGNDDDGTDIWTEFEQELSVGQLWTRKELQGQYLQGELSPTTSLDISFSIFDKDGKFVNEKLELQWNYGVSDLSSAGYGRLSWGDPVGGDIDNAGTAENFAGGKFRIKNFQRIRVNISGNDQSPHTINWISLLTKEKVNIRKRNLTKA